MGNCCSSSSVNEGEDYVLRIVKQLSFKVNSLTYADLREKIEEITKKTKKVDKIKAQLTEFLVEKSAYNPSQADFLFNCHCTILDDIFTALKKNGFSVSKLCLFLFPYLTHPQGENTNTILFKLFLEENEGPLNKNGLEEILEDYIKNCTTRLTFSIWECTEHVELKKKLEEMNASFYISSNIKKIMDKLNGLLYYKMNDSHIDEINEEMFLQNYNQYNIADFQELRNMFLVEFESK